ncbi:helix-turn-helix domain-containing protein [Allomeiothermus silvanus]|uniref:helix-turn-helix domain-containing protein n=1 Tax=Allomeiothermus silvanus TaxID=52022 RepID=UPI0023F1C33A|nr:helix-turn-helix domain-containing protein [Allomeiothermus silvanus]
MAQSESKRQAVGYSGDTERLAYTYKETARLLSISLRTVYDLIEKGKLKKVYITPKAPRITRESLLALLQEREEKVRTKAHGLSEVLRRFGL